MFGLLENLVKFELTFSTTKQQSTIGKKLKLCSRPVFVGI